VRVPDEVALGQANVAMRFEGWPQGRIAPSSHRLPVAARRPTRAVRVSPRQRRAWSFDGYQVYDARYTPDGRTLAILLDRRVKDGHLYQLRLQDVPGGKERARPVQIEPEPLKVTYSPHVAVAADGKSLAVRYNLLRWTRTGKEYTDRENGVIHLIDVVAGRQRWSREVEGVGVYGASFSPDGRTLVTSHTRTTRTGKGRDQKRTHTGEVRFWSVAGGREEGTRAGGAYQLVWDVRFSPDGKYVLISDEQRNRPGGSGEAHHLHVWDVAAKKARLDVAGFFRGAVSPDGSRLAAFTEKGKVKVIDLRTGKELAALALKLQEGWLLGRAWSADGKYLYLGSSQGELWRWPPGGSPVKVTSIAPPQEGEAPRTAWPQGRHLAAGLYAFGVSSDLPQRVSRRTLDDDYAELPAPEVVLWDLNTMRRRATLTGHRGQINCLTFSPDGKTLVSGGSDGTVRFWDVSGDLP
jgi:dipeptidyl aminopeptidase/acylaminoacyl peptidase